MTQEALVLPSGWDGLVHFLRTVSALQAGDRGLRETALSTGFGRSRVAVLRDRVKDALTRLIAAATAEGTLRSGITGHDVALILFMIGEAGQNHESTRPDLTQRYLQVILDGLRARPESRDLGRPMDDEDFDRFVQGWGPSPAGPPRRGSPARTDRRRSPEAPPRVSCGRGDGDSGSGDGQALDPQPGQGPVVDHTELHDAADPVPLMRLRRSEPGGFVELHDCFTITELVLCEVVGLTERGKGRTAPVSSPGRGRLSGRWRRRPPRDRAQRATGSCAARSARS